MFLVPFEKFMNPISPPPVISRALPSYDEDVKRTVKSSLESFTDISKVPREQYRFELGVNLGRSLSNNDDCLDIVNKIDAVIVKLRV